VESSPNEGEGEEQRGGDGLRDDGNVKGRSLSTVHAAEQWKMQKTAKEKGKGKGKSSAAEAGGERELLSTDGRQSFFFFFCFCSSSSRLLSTKINRVET
jgi:hypothetical protein